MRDACFMFLAVDLTQTDLPDLLLKGVPGSVGQWCCGDIDLVFFWSAENFSSTYCLIGGSTSGEFSCERDLS